MNMLVNFQRLRRETQVAVFLIDSEENDVPVDNEVITPSYYLFYLTEGSYKHSLYMGNIRNY